MGGNPILNFILGLALVVGGVIAAYVMYNSGNTSATASNTASYINMMISNTQNDFANNPGNFAGFNNTAAIEAGIPPTTWVPTGQKTSIVDPWGGAVTFAVASVNGGTNNGYTMTLANVPANVCAQIATIYTQQTASISIAGKAVASNPSYGGTATTWPPVPATVDAACSSDTNTIVWTQSGQ